MNTITGAKLLINTLEKLKVRQAFGIPGIHNLDIYEALVDSSIHHVTAKNESGAGFMADGYARVTGMPGIAFVITGPGLTNILTPMAQAYHDSIPMVVISSQIPTSFLNQGTGFLHELKNSTILAQSVAKESRIVPNPESIKHYIEEAYYLSMSGNPGPVHVEIPMDILSANVNEMDASEHIYREFKMSLDTNILDNATNVINEAKTIAIIAGGGAVNAGDEVLSLSNKLSAPVVHTAAGKGIVDERHPLCLGARMHCPEVKNLIKETDVVIGIGTQLSATDLWEVPLSLDGKLIQIDIDSGQFIKNYRADIGIKGDSKEVLQTIVPRLNKKINLGIENIISKIIKESHENLKNLTGVFDTMDFTCEILGIIRKVIPEDGILLTDMTTPSYISLSEYDTYKARTFFHPVGFGTLGYALPAGIGAKLAMPERAVCVLEGDGGFQFTMQELAVAIQQGISLPIIIWNNNGYGEIKRNQEARNFKEKIAVDHENPDFIKLADAYGIKGFRVHNAIEMEQALKESLDEKAVSLIEVNIQ
jgi:thiamine pyrophosphate-dependent acetolactate synthase large subunit-like protein